MKPLATYTVPVDHPALAGHFPDHPVLPGIVLLDLVTAAIGAELGLSGPLELARVKFQRAALPGATLTLAMADALPDRWIGFACHAGPAPLVTGKLRFTQHAPGQ